MAKGKAKTRTKKQQKRLEQKRQRKQAMQALYASYRDKGMNKKSGRAYSKLHKKTISSVSHPEGRCGNPGCIDCYGCNFRPFLTKDNKPKNMPQWMYQMWLKNDKQPFKPRIR